MDAKIGRGRFRTSGVRATWLLLAAVTIVLAGAAGSAQATGLEPATHFVSGLPYTSPLCSSDGGDGEVSLAADGAHRRMVAAWMQALQGLGDPGGAPLDTRIVVTAASRDGGVSWSRTGAPPGGMLCAQPPGPGDVTVDPSVAVGPDGRWYLGRNDGTCLPQGCLGGHVEMSTSTNGTTWTLPVPMFDDGESDYDTVAADPRTAGRAYVVWSNYVGVPNPAAPPLVGRIVISTTTSGGGFWSAPTTVHQAPIGYGLSGRLIVLSDGSLLVVYDQFLPPEILSLGSIFSPGSEAATYATRSTDHGKSWSTPVRIGVHRGADIVDPETRVVYQGGCCGVAAAAGPRGTAAVAWSTTTGTGAGDVWVTTTPDDGHTWQPPVDIHRPNQVFAPAIAAGDQGLAVLWYDMSGPRSSPRELPTRAFAATSGDGGEHWSEEALTAPFDLRSAPSIDGALGGYQSLVATPQGFEAAFTVARPLAQVGASDIVAAQISAP